MKQRNNKKKGQKDIAPPFPSVTTQTQKTIELVTDPAGFQRLCDDVLSACWKYQIHPRGLKVHGTIAGQPDSWGVDTHGKLCALAYGISSNGKWETKLDKDLKKVYASTLEAAPDSQPAVFLFNRMSKIMILLMGNLLGKNIYQIYLLDS